MILLIVVKDLAFPRLVELGNRKVVVQKDEMTKGPSESNFHGPHGKKQKGAHPDDGHQPEISTYFERASKEEPNIDRDSDAVGERNTHVPHIDGADKDEALVMEELNQGSSPPETLGSSPRSFIAGENSFPGKDNAKESRTKDSSAQTDNSYNSIDVEVSQSHYQCSRISDSNVSQSGNNTHTAQEGPLNTPSLQQQAMLSDLGLYNTTLDQYTKLDALEPTTPKPQHQNLDCLIQACNKLLPAAKPVRLAVPLPVDPLNFTHPYDRTFQDVVNAWTQSPLERSKEIWMYPVEDGSSQVRYVSGPPLKKKIVFNVLPEGFATTCPGGYYKVERMLETGVCPHIEGLPSIGGNVIGETPVQQNDDIVLPGER